MKSLLIVLALAWMPFSVHAGLITFEGENGFAGDGAFFDIGDFRFTAESISSGFILVTSQADLIEAATTKLFVANHSNVTMTRIDGMAFNLDSFDLGGSFINNPDRWASTVDALASDGSILNSVVGPGTSYNNLLAAFNNVTSVKWSPFINSGGGPNNYEFILDNIAWSAAAVVPAPATLALFGLGLAGLGWSRRKKA